MMKPISRVAFFLGSLLLVALAGCGGEPVGKVSGKVTFEGKELPGGTVVFVTEDDKKTERVPINSDGTYVSTTVPLGKLKVAVEPGAKGASANMPKGVERPNIPADSPAAKVYANAGTYVDIPKHVRSSATSNLTLTVKSGSQTFDIPLKDAK